MRYKKVFDKNFIDSLPSFDKFSNSAVVALCKRKEPSIKAFRAQIEKWFLNLPDQEKNDMCSRLRSKDDKQHLSAFYELLFHQYCLEEGWEVSKHPSVGSQTPDFLITTQNGTEFFLEVATLMDKEETKRNEERFNNLLRKINKIETDFLVSVHLRKWLKEEVNYTAVVKKIENWLKTLVPKDKAHYEIEVDESGFCGSIDASYYVGLKPKSGCVYAWSPPGFSGNPFIQQVRTAIRGKIKRYKFIKKEKKPFVIAICSSGGFMLDKTAIDNALYGHIVISWNVNNPKGETRVHRDQSGLITPNPGLLGQPQNTRLSAVIFCARIWDKERMLYNMRVFHNPWSTVKLPVEIFSKIPQLVEVKEKKKKGYITLKWVNDRKQFIVFK